MDFNSTSSVSTTGMRQLTEMISYLTNQTVSLADGYGIMLETEGILIQESILSTGLFACLTVLVVAAVWILAKRVRSGQINAVMLSALLALYVATMVYWVMTLWVTMSNYAAAIRSPTQHAQWLLNTTVDCLMGILGNTASQYDSQNVTCSCTTIGSSHASGSVFRETEVNRRFAWRLCAGYAAVAVNVGVGDTIVWWRAFVICGPNRVVRGMGITLVLSTCAMLTLGACSACHPSQTAQPNESPAQIYNMFPGTGGAFGQFIWPMVTACLSLVTNMAATSLIGYQAWRHRQFTKPISSRARAENALLLLVESGILYCALSALVIYHRGLMLGYWGESTRALGGLTCFMEGALVPLLGICPTAIIVVLALKKSLSDTQSSLTIPTIRFTPQDSGPRYGTGSEGAVSQVDNPSTI